MPTPLRLQDLASAQGALRLQRALGSSDAQAAESLVYAQKYLKDHPQLAGLEIGKASQSFFDHDRPRIGLSTPNTPVLAHELGHAADLGLSPSLYKNVVTPRSKQLVNLLDRVALPGAVALSTLVNSDTATKYLNYTTALAAAAAAPNLYNEAVATHIAASKSANYLRTLSKLAPGFIEHSFHSLSPVAKLQAIKYIKDLPPQPRAVATTALAGMTSGIPS
jgi:hypothetical protein